MSKKALITGITGQDVSCFAELMRKFLFFSALVLAAMTMAEEPDEYASAYFGASGRMFLPGNGSSLKRAAGVAAHGAFSCGAWHGRERMVVE